MRSLIGSLWKFIPRGSVVLAVTTGLSYVLGLVRDRIFAQTFGAGTALDSYNAAFLVPDFIFNVLVASGIAAAGMPLFMELQRRQSKEAYHYMSALLSMAVLSMFVVALVILVAAPLLSRLVAPGLSSEAHDLIARLMRIMAWSPLLFAASNALGALLVAKRQFLWYGLSPVAYNVGIIIGALFLVPRLGIVGLAWGTVIGATLHLSARLYDVWRQGWPLTTVWLMPRPLWRRTLRLMVPKMVGHPVELVTFWVFTYFASFLAPGSITVLSLARNFQSVPVSLLGIAVATAVWPTLTEAALVSLAQLRAVVRRTAWLILGISAAAAAALFVIRQPLIALLLGGGEFDEAAVARTALVLGVFCLAIPTESLSHLFARSFYAMQNTMVPVLWGVVNLVVATVGAWMALERFGIVALPVGFFMGSAVKAAGLYWQLWRRTSRQ